MAQVQPLHNSRRDVSVNRCKLYEPVSESISATCHPSLEKIAFSLGTAHFNTPELSQALLSAKLRRMRVRAKLTQSARIAQPPSCRPPTIPAKACLFPRRRHRAAKATKAVAAPPCQVIPVPLHLSRRARKQAATSPQAAIGRVILFRMLAPALRWNRPGRGQRAALAVGGVDEDGHAGADDAQRG